eukprot:symbB.v1.2.037842.t1/scaffold5706.1/size24370/1
MFGEMDIDEPWLLHILTVVAFLLCAYIHSHACQSQLASGIECVAEWLKPATMEAEISQWQRDQQVRFEEELHQVRLRMIKKGSSVFVHSSILFCFATVYKLLHGPCLSSLLHCIVAWVTYSLYPFQDRLKTQAQVRKLKFFILCLNAAFNLGVATETDLVMLDAGEKMSVVFILIICIVLIEVKLTLPLYALESAILTYRRWSLIGISKISPFVMFSSIVGHLIVIGIVALSVHIIRSDIATKLASGDASSLMHGFRHVLRGVCDGDVVLDRRTMTIVDDASCLERLLKSKRKLSESNFMDLFLDESGRDHFLQFLAASHHNDENQATPSVPRGLRVSLQGPGGPVSVDLFHTTLPAPGSGDYCLLAMKEDPDQRVPDAAPDSVPSMHDHSDHFEPSLTRTRSGISEVVVAYDDLREIALLVSDATGLLDIKEVHLSFQRHSPVSSIEAGMPTLRRFIRPSDWDRIEQMFYIASHLPPSEEEQRCFFRKPMFFRLPGESRSYLCSRSTSVHVADRVVQPGSPTHYWMHFTQFDSSQVQKPREQELEGIQEET